MKFNLIIFIFAFSLVMSGITISYAENKSPVVNLDALMPTQTDAPSKAIEQSYNVMTLPDLYRLAFYYNAYDWDKLVDDGVVDTFLKVSECDLARKTYPNEFEWKKLQSATNDYLQFTRGKETVPRYYEYVQTIELDRYDYALHGFPIVNGESYLKDQSNFQFAAFDMAERRCFGDLDYSKFPGSAVLSIKSPITLTFVHVGEKLSQKYIEWLKEKSIKTNESRVAYIRYRLRVDGYEGIRHIQGVNSFMFRGKILRLDVFADKEMLLPLYNQLF